MAHVSIVPSVIAMVILVIAMVILVIAMVILVIAMEILVIAMVIHLLSIGKEDLNKFEQSKSKGRKVLYVFREEVCIEFF